MYKASNENDVPSEPLESKSEAKNKSDAFTLARHLLFEAINRKTYGAVPLGNACVNILPQLVLLQNDNGGKDDPKKGDNAKDGDDRNAGHPLSDEEKVRLQLLHQLLLVLVPGMAIDQKERDSLKKGLEEDAAACRYGPATQSAYQRYIQYIEQESTGYYQNFARALDRLPPRGPIPVPSLDGKTIPMKTFVSMIARGELKTDLGLKVTDTPPSALEVRKLDDTFKFTLPCRDIAEYRQYRRMRAIAETSIDEGGFPPEWKEKLDSPQQCVAALIVISRAREVARLIECIDHLTPKIAEGSVFNEWLNAQDRREWSSKIDRKNLPTGVNYQRSGGQISDVNFSFPKKLDLQDPDFRAQLIEMQKFINRERPIVDHLMAVAHKADINPRNILACRDMEVSRGWVCFSHKDKEGNVIPLWRHSSVRPDLIQDENQRIAGDWKSFNLWELRCGVTIERDPATNNIIGCRPWNTMRACSVPFYSWLNLYKPTVEGTEVIRTEHADNDQLRDLEDFGIVSEDDDPRNSKFMKFKRVNWWASEQEFFRISHQVINGAIDVSMVVAGVGTIGRGWRALRAARTAEGVMSVLNQAAKSGEKVVVAEATALLDLIAKDATQKTLQLAQSELRAEGWKAVRSGVGELLLGLGGISDGSRSEGIPGLEQLMKVRRFAFLWSIGKGTVVDPVRGGIRMAMGSAPKAATLGERVFELSKGYSLCDGLAEAGHRSFNLVQWPMGAMLAASFRDQVRHTLDRGKPDDLLIAIRRLEDARVAAGKLPDEETERERERISYESACLFLDRFKASLKSDLRNPDPDGTTAAHIDRILETTKKFLLPPWERKGLAGPIHPDDVKQFEAERKKFIEEVLVPHFLVSPDAIRDAEVARVHSIKDDASLRATQDKPAFTQADVHAKTLKGEMDSFELPYQQKNDKTFKFDPDIKAAAAAALIYLTKNKKGELVGAADDGEIPAAGILYQRKIDIPAWEADISLPFLYTSVNHSFAVPVKGNDKEGNPLKRAAMNQEIRLADLKDFLEPYIRSGRSSVAHRIDTSELLTRVGLPLETHGKVLMDSIEDPKTSDEQRRQAIFYLGAVIHSLRTVEETRQHTLDRGDLANVSALANNLSSEELKAFLLRYSKSNAARPTDRALARYFVFLFERRDVDETDAVLLESITDAGPAGLPFEKFMGLMKEYAFNKAPKTLEDWDRKLQAAIALETFCDDSGKGPKEGGRDYTIYDCYQIVADCMRSPRQFESASNDSYQEFARLQKLVDVAKEDLKKADDKKQKDIANARYEEASKQCKTAKDTFEMAEKKRINSLRLSHRALACLLERTAVDEFEAPRINHLDNSSVAIYRSSALQARRDFLELFKKVSSDPDDFELKSQFMEKIEPLFSADRIRVDLPQGQEAYEDLANLRITAAAALKAVLLPQLALDDKGNAANDGTKSLLALTGLDGAEARRTRQMFRGLQKEYLELFESAKSCPPLREEIIYALGDLRDRSALKIVQRYMYRENERDAGVRLAAVRVMKLLCPPDEFAKLSQGILNRKQGDKEPPRETDAAVLLALTQNNQPIGLGIAPDGRVFLEAKALVKEIAEEAAVVDRRTLQKQLIEPKFAYLVEAKPLRDKIRNAKANAMSWAWGAMCSTHANGIREIYALEHKAMNGAVEEFEQSIRDIHNTAKFGTGQVKSESRKALEWLATSDGAGWRKDEDAEKACLRSGWGWSYIWVREDRFDKMRSEAATALADCCCLRGRDGKLLVLPDDDLRELNQLLRAGLVDTNAPMFCRLEFMRGLTAIGELTDGRNDLMLKIKVKGVERSVPIAAASLKLIEVQLQKLLELKTTDRNSEKYRIELIKNMIAYIRRHAQDQSSFAVLEGVARWTPSKETPVPVPSEARQAALDAIADLRYRILPVWDSTAIDQVGKDDFVQRLELLRNAALAAGKFFENGQQTRRGEGVDPEILKDLQFREDTSATHLICAATKGWAIQKKSDPLFIPLNELLTNRYSARVREAAAVATIKQSMVPEQRALAIDVLAEQALAGPEREEGMRRDAQTMLDSLKSSADLHAAFSAFETIRAGLLSDFRMELRPAQWPVEDNDLSDEQRKKLQEIKGYSEAEVLDAFAAKSPDDPRLVQYAGCLQILATLPGRFTNKSEAPKRADLETERLLLAALNLYRGAKFAAQLPIEDGSLETGKLGRDLRSKMTCTYSITNFEAPRDYRMVTRCLKQLGDFYSNKRDKAGLAESYYELVADMTAFPFTERSAEYLSERKRALDFSYGRFDGTIEKTIDELSRKFNGYRAKREGDDKFDEKMEKDYREVRKDYYALRKHFNSQLRYFQDTYAELLDLASKTPSAQQFEISVREQLGDIHWRAASELSNFVRMWDFDKTSKESDSCRRALSKAVEQYEECLELLAAQKPKDAERISSIHWKRLYTSLQRERLMPRPDYRELLLEYGDKDRFYPEVVSPELLDFHRDFAFLLFKNKQFAEGDRAFEAWRKLARISSGPNSKEYRQVLESQLKEYRTQKRLLGNAVPIFEELLRLERKVDPMSKAARTCFDEFAEICRTTGRDDQLVEITQAQSKFETKDEAVRLQMQCVSYLKERAEKKNDPRIAKKAEKLFASASAEVMAEFHHQTGLVYFKDKSFEAGDDAFQQSAKAVEKSKGPGSAELVNVLEKQAAVYSEQNRAQVRPGVGAGEQLERIRRQLLQIEQAKGKLTGSLAAAQKNMARILFARGYIGESEKYMKLALESEQKLNPQSGSAKETLNELVLFYGQLKDYGNAQATIRKQASLLQDKEAKALLDEYKWYFEQKDDPIERFEYILPLMKRF